MTHKTTTTDHTHTKIISTQKKNPEQETKTVNHYTDTPATRTEAKCYKEEKQNTAEDMKQEEK